MKELSIDYILASELEPYENNSRTHTEEQLGLIYSSIYELGFTKWRFCVENDCYAVTSCGNVLRVCRKQKSKSGRDIIKYETIVLNGSIDRGGYRTYRMRVDGNRKHVKGHRLVMNAFHGKNKSKCVNHKDGIKINNSLENLEWVTVAENNKHAIETGLLKQKKGINQKIHPSNYIAIYLMIKKLGYKRKSVANMNKVSRTTIDRIYNLTDSIVGNV